MHRGTPAVEGTVAHDRAQGQAGAVEAVAAEAGEEEIIRIAGVVVGLVDVGDGGRGAALGADILAGFVAVVRYVGVRIAHIVAIADPPVARAMRPG